ncbi:phosphatidylinositol N-acetylglucosaminyltransferase subunit P, putative [Plasmodium ovale curtisi]|uniref:Phosphatidylinositol N-acetylglucosaminyltransferase subunit P, putative n=1 Tax=Plasmodium ovale curtisi TaxID=864141 RepID=A0A1A8W2X1_PLAOA|nr:phosphatidylinositol N-acetylglucosaminyltransferase subunit P, putative [Plasmodium ovale curtisi]
MLSHINKKRTKLQTIPNVAKEKLKICTFHYFQQQMREKLNKKASTSLCMYWAAIIPCGIIFTVLCFILYTIIYSFVKTEPTNSANLVEDEYSTFEDEVTEKSMNCMNDMKIEQRYELCVEMLGVDEDVMHAL